MQSYSRIKRRHCHQCMDNVMPTQVRRRRRRRRHLTHRWLRRPGDWKPSGSPFSCWEHWRRILVLCGFYLHTLISWPCRKLVEVGVSHLVSLLFGSNLTAMRWTRKLTDIPARLVEKQVANRLEANLTNYLWETKRKYELERLCEIRNPERSERKIRKRKKRR
jgi:hypothetical protein